MEEVVVGLSVTRKPGPSCIFFFMRSMLVLESGSQSGLFYLLCVYIALHV